MAHVHANLVLQRCDRTAGIADVQFLMVAVSSLQLEGIDRPAFDLFDAGVGRERMFLQASGVVGRYLDFLAAMAVDVTVLVRMNFTRSDRFLDLVHEDEDLRYPFQRGATGEDDDQFFNDQRGLDFEHARVFRLFM